VVEPGVGVPTVVIGTAGHIDHGKTTLLRALTGIDADRLPEERARGMTIDVGFAHLDLDDRTSIDFVDVPGHDRLVGNMLVGAGEIDGVLLVVAADDGPRAQTLEHLALLDALGLRRAVVAITKVDVVEPGRVADVVSQVRALVDRTAMRAAPIVPASGATGAGIPELRGRLVDLRDAVLADLRRTPAGPLRLPIDRAFTIRGRGSVVTGTLRGGAVRVGSELRLVPSDDRRIVRVREVQVHHGRADEAAGGRTALNLAGPGTGELQRGQVLTTGDEVSSTDRLLVVLRWPSAKIIGGAAGADSGAWPPHEGTRPRLHLWTASVDASVRPAGARWVALPALGQEGDRATETAHAAVIRLGHPIAAMVGARAVLRDPGSGRIVAGVLVLDPRPARGASRRRLTAPRLAELAAAIAAHEGGAGGRAAVETALGELHGFRGGELADDVRAALEAAALAGVGDGVAIGNLRARLGRELRRRATVDRVSAAAAAVAVDRLLAGLVADGRLARDGDRLLDPSRRAAIDDAMAGAMTRLEALLDANVPPSLAEAARAAGCPPEGLRHLETSGRIVRVEDDLAWSAARYAVLREVALTMARGGPLAPAAYRDAIGGNRRVALALLEDLGRRGVLRRTEAGHVLGPTAPR
jgi:selenocysteine-specific elongation factor